MAIVGELITTIWDVLGKMAPYLIFGFAMAGLLSVVLPAKWVESHLGGGGPWPAVKATLVGIPLPLCSCSVIPVSAGIRRQGASPGATASFLLATPQTGADSILATYGLLGGTYTIFRVAAALVTGIVGGWLIGALGDHEPLPESEEAGAAPCGTSCCGETPAAGPTAPDAIEDGTRPSAPGRAPWWRRALWHGFVVIPRDLIGSLLVGVVVAGALSALLPPSTFGGYLGGSVGGMVLVMVAAVPLYVCATASIPIAAALILQQGASPGTALAFLIAGPATNAATISVLWKMLGKRSTILYLCTVIVGALGSGLLLDRILSKGAVAEAAAHAHDAAWPWMDDVAATTLLLLLALAWALGRANAAPRDTAREPLADGANPTRDPDRPAEGPADGPAEGLILPVAGMTCGHCAEAVASALRALPAVREARVDLANGLVRVEGAEAQAEAITQVIEHLGYTTPGPIRREPTTNNAPPAAAGGEVREEGS